MHQTSKNQVFAELRDVCLSLRQGCHLLTLIVTHTGFSHSSALSLWQLVLDITVQQPPLLLV